MKTTVVLPFLTYLTLISAAATPHAKRTPSGDGADLQERQAVPPPCDTFGDLNCEEVDGQTRCVVCDHASGIARPAPAAKRQIAPQPSTLSPSQIAALQSYTKPEATNPAMSAVNSALAHAAINPSQLAAQESAFRAAALATPKPAPPLYVGYMPEAQKSYLSSFYAAQASILQKAATTPPPAPSDTKTPAQILPDITGSASSSATAPSSSTTPPPSSSASVSSSQSSSTTLPSPSPTLSPSSSSSAPSSTASSSSVSTGAAAQPTAMAKAAGIGMGLVAGVAAFL